MAFIFVTAMLQSWMIEYLQVFLSEFCKPVF